MLQIVNGLINLNSIKSYNIEKTDDSHCLKCFFFHECFCERVCKGRSRDFISNVRSIKGGRRQHVISDQNFSKEEHLSMDLNESGKFPHCFDGNYTFSKNTHFSLPKTWRAANTVFFAMRPKV